MWLDGSRARDFIPAMPSLLESAIAAARTAGAIQRDNFETELGIGEMLQYDIKLDLDVSCQRAITDVLLADHPHSCVLGEEGRSGDQSAELQWIVDPIDGTVNYFYGIPHFCTSIALRREGEIILGVIYDPMQDELFTVEKGDGARKNGQSIRVSQRAALSDAVITVGFSKSAESIQAGGQRYLQLAHQVRKTRMLGSAALAMAYIAAGRLDAYIEESISLWDVAAGWLMVEEAGGTVDITGDPNAAKFSICASNGRLQGLR
jgi:myo-inositol-1(or 4)-monophosphatase